MLRLLLRLEKLPQRLHVILELGRECLTDFVDFFDNGVLPHGLALKFFWGTNIRRDIPRLTTDVYDTTPSSRIGQKRAVPHAEILHPEDASSGEMDRISGRLPGHGLPGDVQRGERKR